MKKIKINNCDECPFCNKDNEFGRDRCNLKDIELDSKNREELPEDKVHDKCPLKDDDYVITVE